MVQLVKQEVITPPDWAVFPIPIGQVELLGHVRIISKLPVRRKENRIQHEEIGNYPRRKRKPNSIEAENLSKHDYEMHRKEKNSPGRKD